MERIVNQQYAELISMAYSCIPSRILSLVKHVDFFTGTDPIYAGLEIGNDKTLDGKSWKDYVHYLNSDCPEQLLLPKCLRKDTIVIPFLEGVLIEDIVHELGHALDDATSWYQYQTDILPVTEYAKSDCCEAFAEAFTSWLFYDYGKDPDEETLALFRRLENGN